MKKRLCQFILFTAFLLIDQQLIAQQAPAYFDSLSIVKPNRSKYIYEFPDPVLTSISIKSDGKISRPKVPGEGLGSYAGDLGMQAFGGIIGSRNTAVEVICLPTGKIKCADPSLDWEVLLACPGIMNTEKEKTDDGVSVRKTATMYWKEKAQGIIVEGKDTICVFDIISNPDTNKIVSQWSELVYAPRPTRYPIPEVKRIMNYRMEDLFDFYENYGIIGTFRGEQFVLLFNCEQGESVMFGSETLKMIFYNDIDDFEYVPKKDKLTPFIKWNNPKTNAEKYDLIRLAMTSRYLTKILSTGTYPL